MNLRAKIITGYLILVAVIGSMAAILIHERQRIRDIEVETFEIREIRRSIGFQNGKDSHTIGKKRNVIYCIYGIYGFSYLVRYLVNSHSFNDILLHICCASRRKVLILRL